MSVEPGGASIWRLACDRFRAVNGSELVREGALLLALDGVVVEEVNEATPNSDAGDEADAAEGESAQAPAEG